MRGVGLIVIVAFVLLILAIITNSCSQPSCEGFTLPPAPPRGTTMTGAPLGEKEPTPYADVATLPSAPVDGLTKTNSLPYQDPVLEKTAYSQLVMLKDDMDAFAAFELPNLAKRGDPSIQLPLTRFKGDYQRVKDEVAVCKASPGIQPQMTIEDIDIVGANLRYLQRVYRVYSVNEMVPPPQRDITKVGISEGFVGSAPPVPTVDARYVFQNNEWVEACSIININPDIKKSNAPNSQLVSYNYFLPKYPSIPGRYFLKHNSWVSTPVLTTYIITIESNGNVIEEPLLASDYILRATAKGLYPPLPTIRGTYTLYNNSWLLIDDSAYIIYIKDGKIIHQEIFFAHLSTFANTIDISIVGSIPPSSPGTYDFIGGAWQSVDPLSIPTVSRITVTTQSLLELKNNPTSSSPTVTPPPTAPGPVPAPAPAPVQTGPKDPITLTQLITLSQKISNEMLRLQASGTTDPVVSARVSMFSAVKASVDDIITQVKNGNMPASNIPIKNSDYANFLPALGDNSAGIAGLVSKAPSLSGLFNAHDTNDVKGADMNAQLFQTYVDSVVKGLSYNISLNYTSPNEVSKEQAKAAALMAQMGPATYGTHGPYGTAQVPSYGSLATYDGFSSSPGDFASKIQSLDLAGGVQEPNTSKFDWKKLSQTIAENIKKMQMDPADFGCMKEGTQISKDFSWRGHAKMVCSRLSTASDPGVPEQVGCPPVSWEGWRN